MLAQLMGICAKWYFCATNTVCTWRPVCLKT